MSGLWGDGHRVNKDESLDRTEASLVKLVLQLPPTVVLDAVESLRISPAPLSTLAHLEFWVHALVGLIVILNSFVRPP